MNGALLRSAPATAAQIRPTAAQVALTATATATVTVAASATALPKSVKYFGCTWAFTSENRRRVENRNKGKITQVIIVRFMTYRAPSRLVTHATSCMQAQLSIKSRRAVQ